MTAAEALSAKAKRSDRLRSARALKKQSVLEKRKQRAQQKRELNEKKRAKRRQHKKTYLAADETLDLVDALASRLEERSSASLVQSKQRVENWEATSEKRAERKKQKEERRKQAREKFAKEHDEQKREKKRTERNRRQRLAQKKHAVPWLSKAPVLHYEQNTGTGRGRQKKEQGRAFLRAFVQV
ncbi:MAG: hypothetical protein MHM6MM_008984 [Cercozoa sp. M6MM]